MKKIYTVAALLFASLTANAQNVGIGTASPNPSAKLEVVDANRGFLFPRVSLSATNVAAPVTSPANWLCVFNTATVGAGATAVSPGLYYWDGTQWVRFQAGNIATNWTLLGNAGTNTATNFIGTTDAVDFVTRTNNTERMRVLASNGNVGIGTTSPVTGLDIQTGANAGYTGQMVLGTGAQSGKISFRRGNDGNTGAYLGWAAPTDDINFELVNGSGGGVILINGASNGGNIRFNTTASSGVGGNQERMRITDLGNIGIGTTTPAEQLHVTSATPNTATGRFTGLSSTTTIVTNATDALVLVDANGSLRRTNETVRDAWYTNGNATTGLRSIGTTTNQPFQFIANNIARGRVNPTDGEFVWGATASPYAGDALSAVATATTTFALNGYSAQNGSGTWGEILTASTTAFSAVQGVYGGSGQGAGVLGNYNGTNTSNTRAGVVGVCSSPAANAGGVGVRGENSIATGNQRMGVLGQYTATAFGIGVYGIGAGGGIMTGNNDVAVVGWRANNANYSGYFNGNHVIANGTKSASVPTSKGNQLLYCMESPEVWFEDFGTAQLQNGQAEVKLDEMYLETVLIDDEHPMHVFVQVQGECNDVYVIPNKTGFTVKEKQGGQSNVKFSYRLVAKRLHFPDHRFGNDPVWGEGDTRQYSERAPKRAVDYNEQVKQDLEAKRNWKPSPSPAITYPEDLRLNLTKEANKEINK